MGNASDERQCQPRQGFLEKLKSFLFFCDAPYLGLLFIAAYGALYWWFFQALVLYVPIGGLLPRLLWVVSAGVVLCPLWIAISVLALHAIVTTLGKPKGLHAFLVIAGVLVNPVGIGLICWSLFRQRKWLPFILMLATGLLLCLPPVFCLLDMVWWLPVDWLFVVPVAAFAVTALSRPLPTGRTSRLQVAWAFLPGVLACFLLGYCKMQECGIRRDTARIKASIGERLDCPMDTESLRQRLESGFPVSQEPLKTLFAIREDMDGGVFRYLKGHERREELKAILQQFQETHADYVNAAEALMQLPPQRIQHRIPDDSESIYSTPLPEARWFRAVARYYGVMMRADAGDKRRVADCNQAMASVRDWLLKNTILIETLVASSIEQMRLGALCYCLPYAEYTEDEWRMLVGGELDWRDAYARVIADELVWQDDLIRWIFNVSGNPADFVKRELDLPGSMPRAILRRWVEMDCHLGLKYAEKDISIVLDGDKKDALALEEEAKEALDRQFALLSIRMRPHTATIMTMIQQARKRHAMAMLAWQVMDYRRRHDGTLPESLADLSPEGGMPSVDGTPVLYEKGELEIRARNDARTTFRGFRLYCPDEGTAGTTGKNARCFVLVPLEE